MIKNTLRILLIPFIIFLFFQNIYAQNNTVEIYGVYDPTGPTRVNLNPLPAYVGATTDLTWSAASNSTSYRAEVSSNSSFNTILASVNTSDLNASFSGLPESITLYYRVIPKTFDNKEGLSSNIVSSITDRTPPTSQINSATQSGNNIHLTYSATDNGAGLKEIYLYYRFNNSSWVNFGIIPNTFTYDFIPQEGDGNYDFVSISKDNVGNIELKTLNPEASVNFITSSITPTPLPTSTSTPTPTNSNTPIITLPPTPTIIPTLFPTITPPITDETTININLFTIPDSDIFIKTSDKEYKFKSDKSGLFKKEITIDSDNKNISIRIIKDNILVYSGNFTGNNEINILTPPIFDNYYINSPISQSKLTLKGKSIPNSSIILSGFKNQTISATTDANGNFEFSIDITDLQNIYKYSGVYDPNTKPIYYFNFRAIAQYNNLKSDNSKEVLYIIVADPSILAQSPKPPKLDLSLKNIRKEINNYISLHQIFFNILKIITFINLTILYIALAIKFVSYWISKLFKNPIYFLLLPITKLKHYGKIYDHNTTRGIPFVKVQLYKSIDNKLVKETLTNIYGNYYLELPSNYENYYLKIKSDLFSPLNDEILVKSINLDTNKLIVEEYIAVYENKINPKNLKTLLFEFVSNSLLHISNHLIVLLLVLTFVYYLITDHQLSMILTLIYFILLLYIIVIYKNSNLVKGNLIKFYKKNHNIFAEPIILEILETGQKILVDNKGNFRCVIKKGEYNIVLHSKEYEFLRTNKDCIYKSSKMILYKVEKKIKVFKLYVQTVNEIH